MIDDIIVPNYSDEIVKRDVGRNIRRAAAKNHISQKELAGLLHITECTLSRYINGEHLPSLTMCMKLSAIFGVPVDWFCSSE